MTGPTGARPLAGRCVLVTRPRAQAAELVAALETAGADVVIAPTIRIAPPEDRAPLLKAAAEASQFDWIVFSSANAADAFMQAAAETGTTSQLPQVAAVGSRTAEQLRGLGVDVSIVPAEFKAEALLDALSTRESLSGKRVLLPRSELGREIIAEGLRAAGALVTDVVAYRTIAESTDDAPDIRQMLVNGRVDAVTFTSGSAVRSFVQMYGRESVELLRNTVVAVIGPVTAQAAGDLDIPVHVQPATYTTAAMVTALADYFKR